ncbi:NADPH-dependent FMN reductase [Streptomyces sp. 4N124]|uniref:NADPH-dependent FMN reductase n=1 Tax=Streptomyces sp. 4N124 TaxID=3457420 RepID=UPI003FD2FD6A
MTPACRYRCSPFPYSPVHTTPEHQGPTTLHRSSETGTKAVGFVSYGGVGGARAVEHLRLVVGELQMADVRQQVTLSLRTEFEDFSTLKPNEYSAEALNTLFDQVVAWSQALAPLRTAAA